MTCRDCGLCRPLADIGLFLLLLAIRDKGGGSMTERDTGNIADFAVEGRGGE